MPIRKGEDWGSPVSGPPDFTVEGDDPVLAAAIAKNPGARFEFRPRHSDLALTVGLPTDEPTTELTMDALRVDAAGVTGHVAVNMVVLGVVPTRLRCWSRSCEFTIEIDGSEWFAGRATSVVIAVGQFVRGRDLVPKGHPGDGRVEVQVWSLPPGERGLARARLKSGTHLPNPRIKERTARHISVRTTRTVLIEADGWRGQTKQADLEVVPNAYRLLV